MRIMSAMLMLLVASSATAQIHITVDDRITISGFGLDSAGVQQTPDSVRVVVLRNGIEQHDVWYEAADDQCSSLNGGLTFSDAFGDLDNDAGVGLYEIRAGYYLHDDELYDWQTLWVYLGVDLAAIEDTVQGIKDLLDGRESWSLAGRSPIGDTIRRDASTLTEDSNVGVDWSDIINPGATAALSGTMISRVLILDEDFTTIDLDNASVGRLMELGFDLSADDFSSNCFDVSHFTEAFFDSAQGAAESAGGSEGAFAVTFTAVDTLSGQTVPGVRVALRNLEQTSLLAVGRTDPSGCARFNLDAGELLVVADAPGYLFAPFDTVEVGAGTSATIPGRRFDPGSPASPSLCRVYGIVYGVTGLPEGDIAVSAVLPKGVSRTTELIVSPSTVSTTTDSAGYFYLDLIPSASLDDNPKYELTITRPDGAILRKRIIVPDQASWSLAW